MWCTISFTEHIQENNKTFRLVVMEIILKGCFNGTLFMIGLYLIGYILKVIDFNSRNKKK